MALLRVGMEGRNNAGFGLARQLRDGRELAEAEARLTMVEFARRVPPINAKGRLEAYTEQEALASLRSAIRQESHRARLLHRLTIKHGLRKLSTSRRSIWNLYWIATGRTNGEMHCCSHTCSKANASMTSWGKGVVSLAWTFLETR